MARKVITFDDWSGGDLGYRDPGRNWVGTFRAIDMMVYPNGAIGPRPVFTQPTAVSGLPAQTISHMIFNPATGKHIFIMNNLAVYSLEVTSNSSTLTSLGSLASAVTAVTSSGPYVYCVRSGGTGARINIDAATITEVAAVPAGTLIIVHGQQFIVTGGTTNPSRLFYSALGDFTTWPGNFLDVGDGAQVVGIFLQRNALMVAKTGGEWYVVTGVLGDDDVVRRGELGIDYATPSGQSRDQSIHWVNGKSLLTYNGAGISSEFLPDVPSTTISQISVDDIAPIDTGTDDLVIFGTMGVAGASASGFFWLRQSGVWTRHTFPHSGNLPNLSSANFFVEPATNGRILVAVKGSTEDKVYVWDLRVVDPGGGNDLTGSNVTGSLDLPDIWLDGDEVGRIREVWIDLSWRDSPTNGAVSMTINAASTSRIGASGSGSTSATFTRVDDQGDAAYHQQRAVFSFGDQPDGAAVWLAMTIIRLLMIHRITVIIETSPSNPTL